MSYSVRTIPTFDKAVKQLRKKYRRIGEDLRRVAGILADDPFAGTAIPGFSHRVWKIRLASVDMRSGKRGGYRVIYAVDQSTQVCHLMYIYTKREQVDITAPEIESLLLDLEAELDNG
jgi:mRNA-degrading endonuclease RelE of RelBE toxin-antitoxin system